MGSRIKAQRNNLLAEVARLEHEINPYEPTSAMPGSAEKVAVLSKRVIYGLPLWREDEPRLEDYWREQMRHFSECFDTTHGQRGG
ncbi:MAG: hypothetical protein HY372_03660 [Candidatus Andersenbacteria bacterium]|nr:hypothetical protein [Candidatus Andersenbacteria bacterium]